MPPIRPAYPRTLLLGVVLLAGAFGLAACSGLGRAKNDRRATAESLYKTAHKSMENGDYELAVRSYEALTARFPFTDEARQGRLDIIYVYYRKGENESATDAAEQFLRENPTHPRVDYAWYMKGMIEFEHQPMAIERWLGVDMAKRPPGGLQSAINAFATVVRNYPTSVYAHDAQQRLIYLRNRLADYEMSVANYYVKRGAWAAAAQRAQRAIEQYDGAPAMKQALEVLMLSYQRMGLPELEDSARKVYVLNFPDAGRQAAAKRPFWRFW